MDRRRFGLILLTGTVLLMAMGYGSGMMAAGILNNVSHSTRSQVRNKYILNMSLDKTIPQDIAVYNPRFYETDLFLARMYADFFKLEEPPQETEDYYLFTSGKESLYVYKFTSVIEYRLDAEKEMPLDNFKESDALRVAEAFIESKCLSLNYEDAAVNLVNESYDVRFMNRIGTLKNYGFPNQVVVDKSGQVTALTYHFAAYEKLGVIPVMSMHEAFYDLSVDADKVAINNCRMVYIYKDSILQPAYMFQGKTENAEYFESFVEAAFYGIDK